MTIRARVAVFVAVLVAAIVVVMGVTAVRAAEQEVRAEIDDDLLERAERIESGAGRVAPFDPALRRDAEGRPVAPPPGGFRGAPRTDVFRGFVGFDALARVVDADGELLFTLDDDFGTEVEPSTLRAARSGPVLSTVRVDGTQLRVVTVEAGRNVFVQLGRPLDEVDEAVTGLRRRVMVLGVLGVTLAAAGAWLVARQALAPIERLTATTEQIAATGDLGRPVEGSTGEVGRLAASFRAMLAALAASRRQQHDLVMDASHELRTPLTSLRTNVEVLTRGDELAADDRAALLRDIGAEVDDLSSLVAELVDLATDVRADEAVGPVDLVALARSVVERAERRSGRSVVMRVDRRAGVEGRPEALTRALGNLVANAVKFAPDAPIEVVVDGGAVWVHDGGPGIPERERGRVFDRFHRAEHARSHPGSGLGLAIVRDVAEVHGGSVGIEDSPLGGVAVGLRVPTIDETAAEGN